MNACAGSCAAQAWCAVYGAKLAIILNYGGVVTCPRALHILQTRPLPRCPIGASCNPACAVWNHPVVIILWDMSRTRLVLPCHVSICFGAYPDLPFARHDSAPAVALIYTPETVNLTCTYVNALIQMTQAAVYTQAESERMRARDGWRY
jgi:hypothetical protein